MRNRFAIILFGIFFLIHSQRISARPLPLPFDFISGHSEQKKEGWWYPVSTTSLSIASIASQIFFAARGYWVPRGDDASWLFPQMFRGLLFATLFTVAQVGVSTYVLIHPLAIVPGWASLTGVILPGTFVGSATVIFFTCDCWEAFHRGLFLSYGVLFLGSVGSAALGGYLIVVTL